jgi:hypothetical protein
MRKPKKGLEAAITTQHDDEKGLTKDSGKVGLGTATTGAMRPEGGSSKHRKGRRLDG